MILLLELILITFILVMGLKISMSKGMIFESVGNYLEAKVDSGHKVFDLFICPWCMSTLQSVVAHFFAIGIGVLPAEFNWQLLIRWPLVFMGASFVCGNAWNIYETINRIKERNEAEANYYNTLYEIKEEITDGES